MVTRFAPTALMAGVASLLAIAAAEAQPLGTFTWQLQPFCNVVTLNLTQQGAVYTMDGFDDQCGAPERAALVGLATPNADGSITVGLNLVTAPGGRGMQVAARFTLPSASGSWSDSAGNSGTFAFGASTGGSPRPAPASGSPIPNAFALSTDGGFLARGSVNIGTIPASGSGTRMMWHPGKAAFRAGLVSGTQWDDASVGLGSAAMGVNTRASNTGSTAMGSGTTASGDSSTAMGNSTTASGVSSTALGYHTRATGNYSTAFGNLNIAGGSGSLAAGTTSVANGVDAIALGLRVSANGTGSVVIGSDATATTTGTFMYGDRSTLTDLTTFGSNEFLVRAAGGTVFYSNAAMTTGAILLSGTSTWQPIGVSDEHRKTDFRDLDGELVLRKLAAMPVREWRYTTQDAGIRHVGPTAQAFRAAFGLGESDVRIGSVDADGIALAGVKALDVRTQATNDALAHQNDVLMREVADLRARLARLEALLDKR